MSWNPWPRPCHLRVPATLVALIVLLSPGEAPAARRRAPVPCDPGRFVIATGPLAAASVTMSAVVVEPGNMLEVPALCVPVRARRQVSRTATRWTARWRAGCSGVGKGPATLRAKVAAPGCDAVEGTLIARRAGKKLRFQAIRSRCGDGVVDTGAG